MTKSIKLVKYNICKINCEWKEDFQKYSKNNTLSIDYDILKNTDNENLFRLDLFVKNTPEQKSNGTYIDTKIVGYFEFDKDSSENDKEVSIRYSGFPLLYSTLRGHICSATSSFPCGSFLLPTIMVKEVVSAIEEKKQEIE